MSNGEIDLEKLNKAELIELVEELKAELKKVPTISTGAKHEYGELM